MYLENSQGSEGYYCLTIIVFDEHHIYLFNNHYNWNYILKTLIYHSNDQWWFHRRLNTNARNSGKSGRKPLRLSTKVADIIILTCISHRQGFYKRKDKKYHMYRKNLWNTNIIINIYDNNKQFFSWDGSVLTFAQSVDNTVTSLVP